MSQGWNGEDCTCRLLASNGLCPNGLGTLYENKGRIDESNHPYIFFNNGDVIPLGRAASAYRGIRLAGIETRRTLVPGFKSTGAPPRWISG